VAILNRTLAPARPKLAKPKLATPNTGGFRLQLVPLLLLAAGAVAVLGLLRVVQTSQATTASFAMQSLQQEKLELETGVRQLEAEVASLSSLDRIEREAERLGLELPARISYVTTNVAWPAAAEDLLPARFAPQEDPLTAELAAGGIDGSPESSGWWQDVLNLLPFN
jgi:cell division protein FtsL